MAALSQRNEPRDAAKIRMRPVSWAWRDVVPAGMLSLFAGVPGSSKSMLAALVAAEVSKVGHVIQSNLEDTVEAVQVPRLKAAGADMRDVTLWETRLGAYLDVPELVAHMHALEARLLILDPLTAHVPPTRGALLPLARAARETGCAILGVHHTLKGRGIHAIDRIAGPTGGALGTARAVYLLGPNPNKPESGRVLAPVKVNCGPAPRALGFLLRQKRVRGPEYDEMVPLLHLDDDASPFSADDVIAGRPIGEQLDERSGIAAAAEWATNYLRLGPRPVVEMLEDAEKMGVPGTFVRKAVDMVGCRLERLAEGEHWRLPESHPLA